MDYTVLDFWWKVSLTVMNAGIGVYLFWERHNDATKRRIDKLEEDVDTRLDEHTKALAHIDEHVKHMPTHADLATIYRRLNGISEEFNELKGEFTAAHHTLKIIHQHMLTNGGRK